VKTELAITGITCAGCVKTVTEALKKTPGVNDASVNFATRKATVEFDTALADRSKLAAAVAQAGYGVAEEAEDEGPLLKRRLILAAALTAPLLVIAMGPWMHHLALRWVQLALAAPVVLWAGAPFFRSAWKGLLRKAADMNTLIAVGTGSAFVYSAAVVLTGSHRDVYFESAAVIITFILAGRLLEYRARTRASDAIRKLAELTPKNATVIRGGFEMSVSLEQVKPGEVLAVRPGGRVPVDGVVVSGTPSIDEAPLTGESIPVDKAVGDSVYAGTLNGARAFRFEAKAVGRETMLSNIVAMVEQAQGSRAPIARLADQVSGWFAPAVILIAIITFGVWLAFGRPEEALLHFVAVLIVACPCALGLATPAAILVASGRGAQLGILFKGGEAIESAARVSKVVFDKTGTLTTGETRIVSVEGPSETLELAAAVERESEHPLAKAIVSQAGSGGGTATEVEAMPGVGIRGVVGGRRVEVVTDAGRDTGTWLVVHRDGQAVGHIQVGDTVRREARETVDRLSQMGLESYLLSGDRKSVAEHVAVELGIQNVIAPVLPHQKADRIKRLQAEGAKVAMVGDGINDAPALATADVGIALGTGTDVALEAAHVTLVSTSGVDLRKVARALQLARKTLRTIRQNLFWAFVYNVVGIPLAAGLLKPWTGWELTPMFAAAAMALSSVSVVMNSLRLRRA
jgi:Cu+-exporting ATPase